MSLKRPIYMSWFFPLVAGVFFALVVFTFFRGCQEIPNFPLAGENYGAKRLLNEQLKGVNLSTEVDSLQQLRLQKMDEYRKELRKGGLQLQIPKGAGTNTSMDFIAGRWRCDTGLKNVKTGEPVKVVFAFDARGKGSIEIIESGESFLGGAKASITAQGELHVLSDPASNKAENEGHRYSAVEVFCRQSENSGSAIVCQGENLPEKKSKWPAKFYRE
ncbi:MAG: hypothetical protein ABIJ59_00665 [Pseudomonadota bacterium]